MREIHLARFVTGIAYTFALFLVLGVVSIILAMMYRIYTQAPTTFVQGVLVLLALICFVYVVGTVVIARDGESYE